MVEIYLRLMVKMLLHYHLHIIITPFKHHKIENRNMSHSITFLVYKNPYKSEHFLNCKHLKHCCQGDSTASTFCLQIDVASVGLIWSRFWSMLKPLQIRRAKKIWGTWEKSCPFIRKKTVFFFGTPNFFGPSYFEAALGILIGQVPYNSSLLDQCQCHLLRES